MDELTSVQVWLRLKQGGPARLEAAARPRHRTRPPLPLLAIPPFPGPPFLLLLPRHLRHAASIFVASRLVGFLRQVRALLVLQREGHRQVLGATRGFGAEGAADDRRANGAAASGAGGPDGELTDVRRVNFIQKLLQPHSPFEILQCAALIVHELRVSDRALSAKRE